MFDVKNESPPNGLALSVDAAPKMGFAISLEVVGGKFGVAAWPNVGSVVAFSVELPLPKIGALLRVPKPNGLPALVSVVSDGAAKNEVFADDTEGSAAATEALPNANGLAVEGFPPKLIAVDCMLPAAFDVAGVDGAVGARPPKVVPENVFFAKFVAVELLTVALLLLGVLLDSVTDPKEEITGTVAPSDGRALAFKVVDEPKTELAPPNENPVEAGFRVNPSPLGFVSAVFTELSVLPNVKDIPVDAVVVTGFVAADPNAN